MKTTYALAAIAVAAVTTLGGCASSPQQTSTPVYPASSPSHASYYGVVDSIQVVRAAPVSNVGVGAVVGGVVGGLLGNQVGGGSGKKIATVAGVVGGAVVGNQLEQNARTQPGDMYRISVHLDNRSYQTIEQDNLGSLRVGSRVRLENGRVYSY